MAVWSRNDSASLDGVCVGDSLPQEKLALVGAVLLGVGEGEEGVLATRVDVAVLKVGSGRLGDWVIWGAGEVEGTAVGSSNVESQGGDVLAVWLTLVKVLDLEDSLVASWWCGGCAGRWCGDG